MNMQKPNDTNNIDTNTSAGTENTTNDPGQMQSPNTSNQEGNTQINQMQKPTNDNNDQPNIDNKQERPDNINGFPNNQANIKGKIIEFCAYLGFLVISILFVTLYKRRKFKSIK